MEGLTVIDQDGDRAFIPLDQIELIQEQREYGNVAIHVASVDKKLVLTNENFDEIIEKMQRTTW